MVTEPGGIGSGVDTASCPKLKFPTTIVRATGGALSTATSTTFDWTPRRRQTLPPCLPSTKIKSTDANIRSHKEHRDSKQ
jgi:hypothetical protein